MGFEQSGFETGLAYDLRSAAVKSHNANRSKHVARVRDVGALTLAQLDADFGSPFDPVGVIGGPPCQSFSRGNAKKRADDPRTKLVRKFFNLALRLHRSRSGLDFIVMENVPQVAQAMGGRLLKTEIRRLDTAGFDVVIEELDAVDFGVAQVRKRLVLVALNRARYAGVWLQPEKVRNKTNVREALYGLQDPVYFADKDPDTETPVHPNHWCMTPKSKKFFDGSLKPGQAMGRSFKTLCWDRPSFTVSYGHREVHVHPSGQRRLSVYEAMLLQGFPKEFQLKGTLSDQLSQVSEAVPPPLAKAIAKSILRSMNQPNRASNSSRAAA